jgi:broad specificity phosphatase PhoE
VAFSFYLYYMNQSILFVALLSAFASCTNTVYIARHAEKKATPKSDPPLTAEGEQRASDLANTLKGKKLNAVYSTNTRRTISTAQPTAALYKLNTYIYHPNNDSVKLVLKNIFLQKQNALVVGHSNTILPILQTLGINPPKQNVPDWEYDNLFVVKYKRYCFDCTNKFVIKKVKYNKYGSISNPVMAEPSMHK